MATFAVRDQYCSGDANPHCKTFEQVLKEFQFKQDRARPYKQQAHGIPYEFRLDSTKLTPIMGEHVRTAWADAERMRRAQDIFTGRWRFVFIRRVQVEIVVRTVARNYPELHVHDADGGGFGKTIGFDS